MKWLRNFLSFLKIKWIDRHCPNVCLFCKYRKNVCDLWVHIMDVEEKE